MDTKCSSACSVAVSQVGAASVAAAIEAANAKWCAAAAARQCPVSSVDCAPGTPTCVAGRCQLVAPSDRYAFDIVNPIDSGETIVVTKADAGANLCVAAEFFVTVGNPAPRFVRAFARRGAGGCCPMDAYTALSKCDIAPGAPCDWFAASPSPTGSAHVGPGYVLDVDYSILFPALSTALALKASGLSLGQCDAVQ
jgi:hypothetical protein